MKTLQKLLSSVLGLAVIVGLIAALYWGAKWLFGVIGGLNAGSQELLTNGLLLAGGGMLIFIMLASWVLNRLARQRLLLRKTEVYREAIDCWAQLLEPSTQGLQTQLEQRLRQVERDLMLFGDNYVLKRYLASSSEDGRLRPSNAKALERVLFEMRRELGNHKAGLNDGDLLSLLTGVRGKHRVAEPGGIDMQQRGTVN